MAIKNGDFIKLEFTGKIKETGDVFDTTNEEIAKESGILVENKEYGPIPIVVGGNHLLKAIDGQTTRTFAYPCGDTKIHDTDYLASLHQTFIAARGVTPMMQTIDQIDLYNIGCYGMNGQSGKEMIDLVKQAQRTHTLLVFLFHGVGGEHSLNVSVNAHHELLQYLKQNESTIWIAPLKTVATYIKAHQNKTK